MVNATAPLIQRKRGSSITLPLYVVLVAVQQCGSQGVSFPDRRSEMNLMLRNMRNRGYLANLKGLGDLGQYVITSKGIEAIARRERRIVEVLEILRAQRRRSYRRHLERHGDAERARQREKSRRRYWRNPKAAQQARSRCLQNSRRQQSESAMAMLVASVALKGGEA